jgi:hypothetical protein
MKEGTQRKNMGHMLDATRMCHALDFVDLCTRFYKYM